MKQPVVAVGILASVSLRFCFHAPYRINQEPVAGWQTATVQNGQISWNGRLWNELTFRPESYATAVFELEHVVIGRQFHWERSENQRFQGSLQLICSENQLIAVNHILVEDYLASVISSEMSATSSLALLQAHAVISRSWLLAQLRPDNVERKQGAAPMAGPVSPETASSGTASSGTASPRTVSSETASPEAAEPELIRWYNREDHTLFDVCADDHCQRYQGVTKVSAPAVLQAVRDTYGMVLMDQGHICDARFSKCCGGVTEEFAYCWEDRSYPYLRHRRDRAGEGSCPDLTREDEAERWIRTRPPAFCDTGRKDILAQVLNSFDQETTDFYRWKVTYRQEELAALIEQNTGFGLGRIVALQPVVRGKSGRLWKLRLVGTQRSVVVGKELEIRRILSASHLYSSAFVVEQGPPVEGVPEWFTLWGAGWGHGVGLCQIGAAVMSEQGYLFREILQHYYAGAELVTLYSR